MNQVGQVADGARPKLTVSQYRTQYKSRTVMITMTTTGEWVTKHDGFRPHETPEAALAAAVAWVDAQEGNE